jgi:hypothetical protein
MRLRNIILKAWSAAMLMSVAGSALGDGTHAIAVSATVNQVCRITAVPTLAFRASDSMRGGAAGAVQSIGSLSCTKGSTFSVITDNPAWESQTDGMNSPVRLADASGAGCSNAYECVRHARNNVSTGTGLGFGAGNSISFGISVPAAFADYANDVGNAVILTVNP